MGSPRGLTGSVSFGHVSALGREDLQLPGGLRFQGFIQTDAAINLGNSGGPLCDLDGNVIGVNVAIAFGANSIGFAIPASRVKQVVPQLIATGAVLRGWLGVRIVNIDESAEENEQELQDYMDAYGLKSAEGVWVVDLNPEGPAMEAGLRADDVVLKIDGVAVKSKHELIDRISDTKPGTEVILNVWRAGEEVDITVPLAAWKGRPYATYGRDYFGMHVDETTLDSRLAELYGLKEGQLVTVVAVVLPDSPAMKARLQPNDIILEVAQVEVTDKSSLIATLKEKAHPGKSILVHVARPRVEGQNGRVNCFPKIPEDFVIELN
jgi:S1-C subfamily serine protease